MFRFALVSSLLVFLGVAVLPCSGAVTYQLENNAVGDQGTYTIEGTITFDSVCGTSCTNANIDGFSFTYSGTDSNGDPDTGTIDYDPAVDGDITGSSYGIRGESIGDVLNVTATGITFDYTNYDTTPGRNLFRLADKGDGFYLPNMQWQQGADTKPNFVLIGNSNIQLFSNYDDPILYTAGKVTIFTAVTAVPEPSSFLALGLIGVVLGGRTYFARGRKLVG